MKGRMVADECTNRSNDKNSTTHYITVNQQHRHEYVFNPNIWFRYFEKIEDLGGN